MPSYIPDGYTADGYIAPIERLHDGLTFRYRPLLTDERDEWVGLAGRATKPAAKNLVWRNMTIKSLVSWEAVDAKGEALPLNDAALKHFHPALMDRLTNIVMGFDAGDLPPQPTAAQEDQFARDLKALSENRAPGATQQEADAKN